MKFLFVFALFATAVNAAPIDVCSPQEGAKYFLSKWSEGEREFDILSRVEGDSFSLEEGKVVNVEDINGDGVKDAIFLSYSSGGSSGDFIHEFLVQCHGFMRNVGGEYFADVKVLDSHSEISQFRDIKVYSYKRDKQDQIMHKDGKPLTSEYVWRFNPETKLYEGGSR